MGHAEIKAYSDPDPLIQPRYFLSPSEEEEHRKKQYFRLILTLLFSIVRVRTN